MITLLFPILLPIEVALPGALLFALPTMLPVASRWCAQPKLRLPDGFLCRNCAIQVLLVAKLRLPGASLAANGHKNADFVLGKRIACSHKPKDEIAAATIAVQLH